MRGIWENFRNIFGNIKTLSLSNNSSKTSSDKNVSLVDETDNFHSGKIITKPPKLASYDQIMCNKDESSMLPKIAEFGKYFTQYLKDTIDNNILPKKYSNDNVKSEIPFEYYKNTDATNILSNDMKFAGISRKRRIVNDCNIQQPTIIPGFNRVDHEQNILDIDDPSLKYANKIHNKEVNRLLTQIKDEELKQPLHCPTNFNATSQSELYNFGKKRPKSSYGLPSAYVALYNNSNENIPISFETLRYLQKRYNINSLLKKTSKFSSNRKRCKHYTKCGVGKVNTRKNKKRNKCKSCHNTCYSEKCSKKNKKFICSKCNHCFEESDKCNSLERPSGVSNKKPSTDTNTGTKLLPKKNILDYSLQAGDSMLQSPDKNTPTIDCLQKRIGNDATLSCAPPNDNLKLPGNFIPNICIPSSGDFMKSVSTSTFGAFPNITEHSSKLNISQTPTTNKPPQMTQQNNVPSIKLDTNNQNIANPHMTVQTPTNLLLNQTPIENLRFSSIDSTKHENNKNMFDKPTINLLQNKIHEQSINLQHEKLDDNHHTTINVGNVIEESVSTPIVENSQSNNNNDNKNLGDILPTSNGKLFTYNNNENNGTNAIKPSNLFDHSSGKNDHIVKTLEPDNDVKMNITGSINPGSSLLDLQTKKDSIELNSLNNNPISFENVSTIGINKPADLQFLSKLGNKINFGLEQSISDSNNVANKMGSTTDELNIDKNKPCIDKSDPIRFPSSFPSQLTTVVSGKIDTSISNSGLNINSTHNLNPTNKLNEPSSCENVSLESKIFGKSQPITGSFLSTDMNTSLSAAAPKKESNLTSSGNGLNSATSISATNNAWTFGANAISGGFGSTSNNFQTSLTSHKISSFGNDPILTTGNDTQTSGASDLLDSSAHVKSNFGNNTFNSNLQSSGFKFNYNNNDNVNLGNNNLSKFGLNNNQSLNVPSFTTSTSNSQAVGGGIKSKVKPFSFQPVNSNSGYNFNFSSSQPSFSCVAEDTATRPESAGAIGFTFTNTNSTSVVPTFSSSSDSGDTPAMAFMRKRSLRQKRHR